MTFNLHEETHAPFRKPNDNPQYVNVQSNHPKGVLNQVPMSVQCRLNTISSSKEIFEKAKPEYEKALRDSGHNAKLEYRETQKSNKRKRKRRDVIFFNPPFNKEVKTDIGRQFLKLIDKNFPSNNPISEIINRKTVKLSYSCTDNMERVITKHNMKLLNDERDEDSKDIGDGEEDHADLDLLVREPCLAEDAAREQEYDFCPGHLIHNHRHDDPQQRHSVGFPAHELTQAHRLRLFHRLLHL